MLDWVEVVVLMNQMSDDLINRLLAKKYISVGMFCWLPLERYSGSLFIGRSFEPSLKRLFAPKGVTFVPLKHISISSSSPSKHACNIPVGLYIIFIYKTSTKRDKMNNLLDNECKHLFFFSKWVH